MPEKYRNHFRSGLGRLGFVFPTTWVPGDVLHMRQFTLRAQLTDLITSLRIRPFLEPFHRVYTTFTFRKRPHPMPSGSLRLCVNAPVFGSICRRFP